MPGGNTRQNARQYLTPGSFFKLFFTIEIVQQICDWTISYAEEHGHEKPTLFNGKFDITPEEMYRYFALLMYMAVVQAPNVDSYWSTSPLFHGLWARHFMSKLRFKAIQSFLKVCDAFTENRLTDKLCKVRLLHDYIRSKCKRLYQPYMNISIDERMVRNRGRFTFRQFIKDKPTRWGMKLWVMADAANGYTYDFEVYTGKGTPVSRNGLAYDVVMRLCQCIQKQGYHVYFDNFYTGVQLVKDLLLNKTVCCGTIIPNRKGVPSVFKDTKVFAKGARGMMRWKREGNLLFLQWLDNKPVTFLSTIHQRAHDYSYAKRRTKVNGQYRPLHVRQPKVVDSYNKSMGGVDRSDQLIGKYKTLRKTNRWWKTLFYHFLDIARVNAYILFNDFRAKNPDIQELSRPKSYNQLDFTLELIKELGGVDDDANTPLFTDQAVPTPDDVAFTGHSIKPAIGPVSLNCKRCYRLYKIERKSRVMCAVCGKHLCFNPKRNCLWDEHA